MVKETGGAIQTARVVCCMYHHHHLGQHTPAFRRLVYFNRFYIALSVFNATLAVGFNLKARFFSWQSEQPVWLDYLLGIGTSISPPLLLTCFQFLLTDISFKHTKGGNLSIALLLWINILNCIAALLQPMNIAHSWSAIYTILHFVMILIPIIIAWLCFDVFLNRSQENNI